MATVEQPQNLSNQSSELQFTNSATYAMVVTGNSAPHRDPPREEHPSTIPESDSSLPTNTNLTRPRRVRKACCGCRRDKVRCDGSRPCAACLKKGIDILCIDGCAPCRKSREICDGRKPCRNCDERRLECEAESNSIHEAASPTMPPTTVGERAKLACLACRRDNKKCEDQRPCARCVARSEECIHVNRGPKLVKSRCRACRDQNRKCEDIRPCRYCAELGERCFDVPRKGRGHGTRVKTACMACRRNKTQCGNERPCKNCEKRGLDCFDRICTCAEQTLGTKCYTCQLSQSQENAFGSSSHPPSSDTPSFTTSIHSTNYDGSFGFPPSNDLQPDFQALPYTSFNIDPRLMGPS